MLSGLTNNRDTGLDLGIRASHKGTDGGHCGVSCNSNIHLLKTSSNFDGHFTKTISPRGEIIFNTKPESQQHRRGVSVHVKQINMDLSPLQKISQLTQQGDGETKGMLSLFTRF